MRLNSANRSFASIVVVGAVSFGLFVGTACCWALSMVLYRLTTGGAAALTQVSTLAALLLIALLGASSLLAVRSFRSQSADSRRLGHWVRQHRAPPEPGLTRAAQASQLGDRVDLVEADTPFSFAYDALRPRVAVSSRLVESVSAAELEAVLHHESYHVAAYDPLKVVLARSLPDSLFFIPVLAELRSRYVTARELAADRQAIGTAGPIPLAGALYKVEAGPPEIELGAAAAIGGDEALDARVTQLESGAEPPLGRLSRSRMIAIFGAGGVLIWATVSSFIGFAPLMARLCTGH
jgi:Zn-dependent protease with chaperone function